MREAVLKHLGGRDALIMAAAVADFSPLRREGRKIEKVDLPGIDLAKTPDILSEVGAMERRPLLVGFAAETGPDTGRAVRKLAEKNADIIVFNDVSSPGAGFDVDTNRIIIITRDGMTELPLMTKEEAADIVLDKIAQLFLDIS